MEGISNKFDEYIRQSEPDKKDKAYAWKAAIGLQDVDGLKTSEYLHNTANEHIEGQIDIEEVKTRLDSYYKSKTSRDELNARTEEADKVSARITELLSERNFLFSPLELKNIHLRLFKDIYGFAGIFRDYNITKREWVLNGDTVLYAGAEMIQETLEYDFQREKQYSYRSLSIGDMIKHLSSFIADLWQIHPFGEGNTRTTAVFLIKYLRNFGFEVNNDVFADYSWFFRNALVRANYNNYTKGIFATTEYLELFLRNLLLEEKNELKNRLLHVESSVHNEEERLRDR